MVMPLRGYYSMEQPYAQLLKHVPDRGRQEAAAFSWREKQFQTIDKYP